MALIDSNDVELRISAETSGDAQVRSLADQIEALAREGGEAAPQFAALAAEMRKIEQQQGLITAFGKLKTETGAAAIALESAQQKAQALGRELATTENPSRKLTNEFARAKREVDKAKDALQEKRVALQGVRGELGRTEVNVRDLSAEQIRLKRALADTSAGAQQQIAAFRANAEATQRAQEAARNTAASATASGRSLQEAFGAVGVRSANALEQEILDVQQALHRIASEGRVTGREFDRVWKAGQERIARLRAELDGTAGAMGAVEHKTGGVVAGLKRIAGAFLGIEAARRFLDANVELEQLRRGLVAVTGDSGKAEAELARLRATADRLGVGLGGLAREYISLAAATRGSTLEGQATRDVFDAVTSSMSALGGSSEKTTNALTAVSQIASKGVVSMEELRGQLGEALPGAMDAAARGLGITKQEMTALVESGNLLAEDFLPALAKGLRETFGDGTQRVDGFAAAWQRLKNTFSETSTTLGDLGFMDALATMAEATATGVNHVAAAFMLVGKQIGITAGAIATFDLTSPIESIRSWWQALGEAEAEVKAKLDGVGKASDAAAAGATRAGQAGAQAGQQIAGAAPQIDTTANAMQGAAAAAEQAAAGATVAGNATQQAGTQAQGASAGWVAINNAYTQAMAGAQGYTAETLKLAEAKRVEGEATVRQAELTGNEIAVLEARATAAANNLAVAQQVAAARQAEAATIQSQVAALKLEGEQTGGLTAAKQNQIAALEKLIAQKAIEAQKSAESVKLLDAEAQAANRAAFSVEAAFQRMGVTSTAALKQAADAALRNFNIIAKSGKASADDLAAAWRVYAERAIEANRGVADYALKAQAAQYGLKVESDESGKTIVRSMREAAAETARLGTVAEDAAAKFGSIGDAAKSAAGDVRSASGAASGGGAGGGSGGGTFRRMDMGQEALFSRAERLGGLALRKEIEAGLTQAVRSIPEIQGGTNNGMAQFFDVMKSFGDRLDALQIEQEKASGKFAANQPRATGHTTSGTYRVEIGLGAGRVTTIETANDASARALVSTLQELAGRAN